MRLRNLRKLEEFEIRKEHEALSAEKAEIETLLASDDKLWQTVAWEIGEVKKKYAKATELGRRRTAFADAPDADLEAIQQAMIEKEPITDVVSRKRLDPGAEGTYLRYVRSDLQGRRWVEGGLPGPDHRQDPAGDHRRKVYTLAGDKLPGGRGHGEPIRIMGIWKTTRTC